MNKKFIFDLDGTITKEETLPLISNHFSLKKEIEHLTKETVAGNIPFIESFINRVNLLKDLPVSEINDLISKVKLNKEIIEFINKNKDNCIIATGNLDCWVEKLCKLIGCVYYTSNAKVKDNKIIKLSKILKKEDIVNYYKENGCKVIYIGDGHNDLEAMRIADVSIACGIVHNPAHSILPFSNYLVYSQTTLCNLIQRL
jgi:HAD superfamily phosphoserine phosphatase-like hydrolase